MTDMESHILTKTSQPVLFFTVSILQNLTLLCSPITNGDVAISSEEFKSDIHRIALSPREWLSSNCLQRII